MKGRIRNQGAWLSLGIGKQSVLDRVAQDRETSTSPPRLSCPADKWHTGTGQRRRRRRWHNLGTLNSRSVGVGLASYSLLTKWTGQFGCLRPSLSLSPPPPLGNLKRPNGRRRVKDGGSGTKILCFRPSREKCPRKMPTHTSSRNEKKEKEAHF
ncbi:hypothetical protein B0T13DRAFT_482016 [Neurospora crassa]|nr:hypothetical protein B0T13DRAFT_482016 [Neurospora crassa]